MRSLGLTPEEWVVRKRELWLAWRDRNFEHWQEYQRKYQREYRQRNSAKRTAYSTEWNRVHPEVSKAHSRASKRRHPEKRVDEEHRRRARVHGAGWEPVDRTVVFERDGWRCHLCGRRVRRSEASIDHLIPIADGGPHTYANVATAHLACNIRRGRKGEVQLRLA